MKTSFKKVNFVVSCGNACRPARYTRMLYKRKFSSPCDWMMRYSLSDFIEILQTRGTLMFQNARINHEKSWVEDTRSGMISMHDFDCKLPLEDQLPQFYNKMQRRAINTVNKINASSSVGIVMNRNEDIYALTSFCQSLCSMFPKCNFHILNIRDVPESTEMVVDFCFETDRYSVTQISFNDEHKNGRNSKTNGDFWLGNEHKWILALNYFRVRGEKLQKFSFKTKRLLKKIIKKLSGIFHRN